MLEKTHYIEKQRHTRAIIGVFFGIIVFLTVFSPFYLLTVQYHVGYIIKELFTWIGRACMMGGGTLLALFIINLFASKRINLKWLVTAIALLWIAGWCTGSVVELFGIPIGNTQPIGTGKGYH